MKEAVPGDRWQSLFPRLAPELENRNQGAGGTWAMADGS